MPNCQIPFTNAFFQKEWWFPFMCFDSSNVAFLTLSYYNLRIPGANLINIQILGIRLRIKKPVPACIEA